MTLEEIKEAVNKHIEVYYKSSNYVVTRSGDEYFIMALGNGHTIGLTHMDDVTMNGKEEDFFMMRSSEDMIELLVASDIKDIMASAEYADYEFLANVLKGSGFKQYGKMTAAELHTEYMEMESNKREES